MINSHATVWNIEKKFQPDITCRHRKRWRSCMQIGAIMIFSFWLYRRTWEVKLNEDITDTNRAWFALLNSRMTGDTMEYKVASPSFFLNISGTRKNSRNAKMHLRHFLERSEMMKQFQPGTTWRRRKWGCCPCPVISIENRRSYNFRPIYANKSESEVVVVHPALNEIRIMR